MLRIVMTAILCLTISPLLVNAASTPAPFMPGELLIMLQSGAPRLLAADGRSVTGDSELVLILERHGLTEGVSLDADQIMKLVSTRSDFDPCVAARDLLADNLVRAASPNYILSLCVLPNDPMLGSQWHIQHSGDADIDLPEAWEISTGEANVVIAILDTGLDWTHPDLQEAVWTNPDEIPGNGIDDDGNGWIDDIHGWDVGNDDADPIPEVYLETGIEVGFQGTH